MSDEEKNAQLYEVKVSTAVPVLATSMEEAAQIVRRDIDAIADHMWSFDVAEMDESLAGVYGNDHPMVGELSDCFTVMEFWREIQERKRVKAALAEQDKRQGKLFGEEFLRE